MKGKIEEIKRRYKGYWLGIKVTKRNKYQKPIEGELVAQAKSHRGLHRRLKDPNVYDTYSGKIPTKAVLF